MATVAVAAVVIIWMNVGPGTGPVEAPLLVGQSAPDFALENALGGEVHLADYFGQQAVLVYFSMGPG